tara:strand:+ start:1094 stop:1270 length:177 start_codon:yes stop_codon:yes gene_type:complete
MKNFPIVFLLIPHISITQSISCDELLEELKYNGDRLDTSYIYDSDAISPKVFNKKWSC